MTTAGSGAAAQLPRQEARCCSDDATSSRTEPQSEAVRVGAYINWINYRHHVVDFQQHLLDIQRWVPQSPCGLRHPTLICLAALW